MKPDLLQSIIDAPRVHARWLNTLSYLENCGARKIARCQHPMLVREEMLKHAAEEFRHAHHLKKQIRKVSDEPLYDYHSRFMLGGWATAHYLNQLDLQACRYLSKTMLKDQTTALAYLLVTYVIELRAEELYLLYDQCLRKCGCKVAIKCIFLEEKEHLEEMKNRLNQVVGGFLHADAVKAMEQQIYQKWIQGIEKEVRTQ